MSTPSDHIPSTPEGWADHLLSELRARANPDNVAGMARFGISPVGTLGVTVADSRALVREAKAALGRDHAAWHRVAELLWDSGVHEARIMASMLGAPELLTRERALAWALDIDSWDTCDQLCGNLLWKTPYAWEIAREWSRRPETFVKRVGLVTMVQVSGKDKRTSDTDVVGLLGILEQVVFDERNDVKKAASWVLRQIGKRDAACNGPAIESAERILAAALAVKPPTDASKAARWVARDALRELRSDAVRTRLGLA
jgi:3-methyladenine DNA glycosylase AlkD